MILQEEDIAIVQDLILTYQKYINECNRPFVAQFAGIPFYIGMTEYSKLVGNMRDLGSHITTKMPLVLAALSGDLPSGFSMIKMCGEQYYAWCSDMSTGTTTQFQGLLRCWEHQVLHNAEVEE